MDGGGRFLRSLSSRSRAGLARAPQAHPVLAWVLTAAVVGGAGLLGAVRGGQYDALVANYGTPADIGARALGFDIRAVAISGLSQLRQAQVLDLAGIGPNSSLAFLNVRQARENLLK